MGMITITITKRPQIRPRTRDNGADLASLYADLYERLHRVSEVINGKTHDDFNPDDHPHAPAGQSNGGQFVSHGGGGAKPTSTKAKAAKAAMHELFSSGHPFTKQELMTIAGVKTEKLFSDYIAMLKNPKYAGGKGALQIKKLPNGAYQVVMPNGQPAPPAPAEAKPAEEPPVKVEPMVIKHNAEPYVPKVTVPFAPVSKEKADKSYAHTLSMAQDNMLEAIQDNGVHPEKAVLAYKKTKALAMAQWSANTTGKMHEPKYDDTVYGADKILASDLSKLDESGEGVEEALIEWKKNTQLEKQGKLGTPAAPKPETKLLEKAVGSWLDVVKNEPPPQPKPYEHLVPADFKHISADDFTKTGKDNFGYQMQSLKKQLEAKSVGDAEGNKKLVEKSLQEHLKDKKHFQALKAMFNAASGIGHDLERRLISTWASSSGDSNSLSCAMQIACQDAFALPEDAITKQQLHSITSENTDKLMHTAASSLGLSTKTAEEAKVVRQGLQEFVQGQYENTQKMFKDMGQTHVMVARGMKNKPGPERFTAKPTNVKLQPASSFSANYNTASSFAGLHGTVYLCKIPVSQVLGTYLTGFGCTSEHEVVVLGHDTIMSFPIGKGGPSSLSEACDAVSRRIKGK